MSLLKNNKLEPLKLFSMKKFLALTLMGLMLTVVLASCGSSKGGHCDAYGSVDQVESTDLAAL